MGKMEEQDSKDYDSKDTPVAKYVSDNILTLPIYPGLSMEDVDDICDVIEEELSHGNS